MTPEEIDKFADIVSYSPSKVCQGICNDDNGVHAMVLYDWWTKSGVQMHVWSDSPKHLFDKKFIHEVFWFPFVYGKREIAFAVTPADNAASLAVARALGFRETYRIKDGWDLGTCMVIQEIRRSECRFLETIGEQELQSA
jgi:hypothetical protein